MIRKHLLIFIPLIAFITVIKADDKYPYQKPDRFNQDYQKSNYIFAGDLYFYTDFLPDVAKNKNIDTKSPLVNPNSKNSYLAQFTPNIKYNIFSMYYQQGQDEECDAYTLPKPIMGNTRIIFYSPNMISYPNIAITRNPGEDTIQIYVGNPSKKQMGGSKLIFNIDSFEKYMKTTAWYNTRPKLGEKRFAWRDSAITFGFAINADDFNFTVPESINNFTINFVEIIGASRWATCRREERYQYIKRIVPFTETMKIAETNTKNSLKDLFEPHTITWQGTAITIPAIVTIKTMDQNDFDTLRKLISQGNSN